MTGEDQRAAYLQRDQDMLAGFPKAITRGAITAGTPTGDGESSPVLADLDGDNRNELIVAGSDGFVHALRARRHRARRAGRCAATRRRFTPASARSSQRRGLRATSAARSSARSRSADTNGDGVPEVYAADMEGKVYGWGADGAPRLQRARPNPRFSGKPLQPFVNSRHGRVATAPSTASSASPVLADLDGDGGRR